MSLVSFVKVGQNSTNSLRQAILESLNLIDYSFQKANKHVVIKPNMCYYWHCSTGETTDPKFVAALIDVIREEVSPSADISIVESDASAMKCKYVFKYLGYEKMVNNHNVRLVNLSENKGEKVEVTAGSQQFCFTVPDTIRNADLLISLPKIKYLARTKISCSLKNTFGCNPYPNKFQYHPKLDEAIVALNKAIKFNVYMLDGIVVSGKQPRRLDLVMASQDPVALDTAAAKLAGINPKKVRHIALASQEGLGNMAFIPKGADPEFFQKRYPRKGLKDRALLSAYRFATWTGLLKKES